MGFSPTIWGSETWHSIHAIALAYPNNPTDEQKQQYKDFFETLVNVLPCNICGDHLKENYKKLPIQLDSSKELFSWTVSLHNLVNEQTNKPHLTNEEAYKAFISKGKKKIDTAYYLIGGMVIGAGAILVAKYLTDK